jgi:hypothetical protein
MTKIDFDNIDPIGKEWIISMSKLPLEDQKIYCEYIDKSGIIEKINNATEKFDQIIFLNENKRNN